MKNLILIQILLVFISSCSDGQKSNLTAEQIWEKHLEAYGDKEKILNIKTCSSTSVSESKYGKINSNVKMKFPDKIYQEFIYPNNDTTTIILNGDSGIVKSPAGIEPLSDTEIRGMKQSALIFPEFYFEELGYKIELIGEERIDNHAYYKIKVTTDVEEVVFFIDCNSFVVFRIVTGDQIAEIIESEFVDGIRETKVMEIKSSQRSMINKNLGGKYNIELDDSIFELK